MIATHILQDPCAERAIAALATTTNESIAEGVDLTTMVAFPARTPGRERTVKLIQHPSFVRAADLGPDPRFTLAGRAPHLQSELARAA